MAGTSALSDTPQQRDNETPKDAEPVFTSPLIGLSAFIGMRTVVRVTSNKSATNVLQDSGSDITTTRERMTFKRLAPIVVYPDITKRPV